MENSRASSLAQLSAWTDVMKNTNNGKMGSFKQTVPEEDEYEEEFEDYDEEFEEAHEATPPKIANAKSDHLSIAQSKPSHNTFEQDKKTSAYAKSSSEYKVSVSRSIADPRTVRIHRILNSGVLNLQHEKFTLYNSLPTPPYEYYIQSLRSFNSSIRQVGVPNDVELCDMEVNTDDISVSDKEVQHCYEDDLPFYKMLEKVREGKYTKQQNGSFFESFHNENIRPSEGDEGDGDNLNVNKLSNFLEKSMAIFEEISRKSSSISETSETKSAVGDKSRMSLIDTKADWIAFGKDYKYGHNELLRTRTNQCAVFSTLQPQLFVVSHPPPVGTDAELDLRPLKALYSIWDVNKVECPSFLLESTGIPSVCCFSSTQSYIVVAGTVEGNIHLWDLRESSSFHRDKDAEDLKISKGIRKPTFSTHLSTAQLSGANIMGNALDDESLYCQTGCILSIESLDSSDSDKMNSTATSSQFVSVDEFGTVMFWVTNEILSTTSIDENLRQSPWGRTILLATKCISIHNVQSFNQLKYNGISSSNNNNKQPRLLREDFMKLRHHAIATIPGDSSSLLFTGANGQLHRISRTGQSSFPCVYSRASNDEFSSGVVGLSNASKQIMSYESITTVSVRPPVVFHKKPSVDLAQLVLVGRENGSLDLFQLDSSQPIHSWVLTAVKTNGTDNSKLTNNIICIKWLQFAKSAFIVIDSDGTLFYFDLLHDFYHPIFAESIALKSGESLTRGAIDLSRLNSTLDTYRVVTIYNSSKSGHHSGTINLRCLNSAVSIAKKYTDEDELELQEKLLSIVTSTVKTTCVSLSEKK